MRIVVIDPISATPPYDHALAAALGRRGHDVHLVTSGFRFGELPPVVGFLRHELLFPLTERLFARAPRSRLRLAARAIEYLPSARTLTRHVKALDPDIVHVQWLPRPRVDMVWLRALARERPTLLTAHNVFPRRRRDLRAWRKALETVDGVVVPYRGGADALVQFGVRAEHLTIVRHPVFRPASPEVRVTRDESLLLFFGLVRTYKGVDLLVRALPVIVEAVPTARLAVAGDPMDTVGGLRKLATKLGVADRIDWQLGFLPDQEVSESMCRSSIVVLPYRAGASSGALAAALGHGRPVVVSDVGSLGEIVREFHAGRVVARADERALASACIELLSDPHAWREAASGADEAARVMTWDVAAEEHERAYARAIGARRAVS